MSSSRGAGVGWKTGAEPEGEAVDAVEEQGMEVRARTEETGLRFSCVRPRCGEAHLAVGLVGEVLLGCPKRRDNTLVSIRRDAFAERRQMTVIRWSFLHAIA